MGRSTPARAVTFHRSRRACAFRMPAYDKLTNNYAKWLIDSKNPLIDRYDWGEWNERDKCPKPAATNDRLEFWFKKLAYPPQCFTRTTLKSQIDRSRKIYYTSRRQSGFALVCIDVDAHHGQTDAFEAATFIRSNYFPLAHLEPSRRGFHVYVLVRVGRCRRWKFNVLLAHLQENLRSVLVENNFESTVEVLGGFTIVEQDGTVRRANLAPLPELPNGHADLKRLVEMPVYLISAFFSVRHDADLAREVEDEDDDGDQPPARTARRVPGRDSPCAWDRMQWACFDFTVQHRRLPHVEELLAYYQQVYDVDAGDHRRRRRAEFAIRYRAKTFDISRATDGGFELHRQRLLADVVTHCTDRSSKYDDGEINDEDLAIGLYVVMRNSFSVAEDARRQYSCPKKAFSGMFRTLKEARVTKRGGADPNKIVAIKVILNRARLIECVDSGYIHGDRWGVGMKYTLGPSCWRHAEFIRFAENINVVYVSDIREAAKTARKDNRTVA